MKKKKKYYRPYDLNIKYEKKTYKYIGKDYGDSETAHLGLISNLLRCFRKWRNKEQKKYAFCDTYSVWEEHIKKKIPDDKLRHKNMYHWLLRIERIAKSNLKVLEIVLVPAYMVLIGGFFSDVTDNMSNEVKGIIMIFIVLFSVCITYKMRHEVEFYSDIRKIAQVGLENLEQIPPRE